MSVLNFSDGGRSRAPKDKPAKIILGIGLLSIAVALGSTLAANININSGPVEFGQGVAQTTACDSAITITPNSSFDNSATPTPAPTPTTATGVFVLGSITVSGVDSGDGTGCDGKYLTLKGYGESSNTPLDLIDGTSSFTIYVNYGSDFTTPQSGFTVETIDSSSFTITFTSPTQSSSALYKLTIESSDTSPNPTASPSSSESASPSESASSSPSASPIACASNCSSVDHYGNFIGGTGGSHDVSLCEEGYVVTAFSVTPNSNFNYLGALSFTCSQLNNDVTINYSSQYIHGWAGLGAGDVGNVCPAGQAAVAMPGVTAGYTSNVTLTCEDMPAAGNSFTIPFSQSGLLNAEDWTATETSSCNTGEFVVGFSIQHGSGLDGVQVACRAFAPPLP
ncbi:MAG: hypothetical protein NT152_04385 [Actinobacteria bacterium]|nr:hypothetical protein [Actinomycetota bacterium]